MTKMDEAVLMIKNMSIEELKDFIDENLCPSDFGMKEYCTDDCSDCWK